MIYVTGDTHIPIDISKLNTKKFPEQKELTGDDFVIICGDFGGVWDNSSEEHYWIKWFEEKNFTTLFIDGNHENFDMLNSLEVVDFYGGMAHKVSDKIYHLMRGQVYNIDGKSVFTFGGASSHDKERRTEGISWWKEELPTEAELELAKQNLDKVNWQVDYVITHCTSTSWQRYFDVTMKSDVLTDFLDEIKENLTYKKWFWGHYHMDIAFDEKHTMIFDKVIKL
ncbi:MAG: metallophosphoesterase [Acutalibacteraceae bacterium]|nr:metallophosphoesterase [Acutalibacteraceae bacterium]